MTAAPHLRLESIVKTFGTFTAPRRVSFRPTPMRDSKAAASRLNWSINCVVRALLLMASRSSSNISSVNFCVASSGGKKVAVMAK